MTNFLPASLAEEYSKVSRQFSTITIDSFLRAKIICEGIKVGDEISFPDSFGYYELCLSLPTFFSDQVMAFMQPESNFEIIEAGDENKVLLHQGNFVDRINRFEKNFFNLKTEEPFFFYVYHPNGDLVLKLNPIQLCDFFQNSRGEKPCFFCFRNDMVHRFKNIDAESLIEQIFQQEQARDNLETLRQIDEISIVTGSYTNDQEYLEQMILLVQGLKDRLKQPNLRTVIGSHEGRGKEMYQALKEAGVTTFTFAVESLQDSVRKERMPNRKGQVPISQVEQDISEAVDVFGEDGVIIRLVAGLGDTLDKSFEGRISRLCSLGTLGKGPWWDVNIFVPFTHYHWRLFSKNRPYTLEYIYQYYNLINTYVPFERRIRFKVAA